MFPNNNHYDTERIRGIEPSNLNILHSRGQSSRGLDELDSHISAGYDHLFRDNDQQDSSTSTNQVQSVADTGPFNPRTSAGHEPDSLDPRAPASHGQLIQSVSQLQPDNSTSHDPSLRGIGQSEASDFIRLSRSVECDDNNTRRAHMHTNTIRDLESQGNLVIYDYTV